MKKNCPNCSNPLQATTLDKVSATDGPLTVTALGMPAAKCAKNHLSPIDGDFMLWLIHDLKERQASLPAGTEQGMLFKKYLCACGKELAAKSERGQSYPFDMAYEGAAPFKAELSMPVYKCTGCGKEQLRSHKVVSGHVAQAIASLNDAAGFPHSG